MVSSVGGGTSGLSPISNKKLDVEVAILQGAYLGVDFLIDKDPKNPKVLAALQAALNGIRDNFSKIIKMKYGITAEQVVSNLSPAQVNAISTQIASAMTQFDALTSDIAAKNDAIALLQAQISANNTFILVRDDPNDPRSIALQQENDALNGQIVTIQAQIEADITQQTAITASLGNLNQQLQAAETVVNNAITLFDSFKPIEKKLFKELYPQAVFPV